MSEKRHLRVLLLFESNGPPEPDQRYEEYMRTEPLWKTEGDVLSALRENGHEVFFGPLREHPRELIDHIDRTKPDLVWNSLESFRNQRVFESNVVGLLELLGVSYTGCDSRCLMLCQDKALSKKILRHHRVLVPPFVVSPRQRPLRKIGRSIFPALVKPLDEEGSVGIARDSFVENEAAALKRVEFLHERLHKDVIVEQYIEGTEIYSSVVGDRRVSVLPPRQLRFDKVPDGEPRIASYHAKWNDEYRERWGISGAFCDDLPAPVIRAIAAATKRSYLALGMRGYGRIDMRLTPENRLYVVEANPNPQIAREEDLAESAGRAGIDYLRLIERITRIGMRMAGTAAG